MSDQTVFHFETEIRTPLVRCSLVTTGWSKKRVCNKQVPGVWSESLGTRALQANRSEFCPDLGGKRSKTV
ncbi:hypothetical protein L596_010901 [Steinernema carpocapsae]|uniref:Uncharacterized protein n=1 Tax=Steinernema carpocapsae TaxID=34508 RepID=A0A4U5PK13_STECR|nr:hypothetical protein L596_010901 [Steinernema carpocapsae]